MNHLWIVSVCIGRLHTGFGTGVPRNLFFPYLIRLASSLYSRCGVVLYADRVLSDRRYSLLLWAIYSLTRAHAPSFWGLNQEKGEACVDKAWDSVIRRYRVQATIYIHYGRGRIAYRRNVAALKLWPPDSERSDDSILSVWTSLRNLTNPGNTHRHGERPSCDIGFITTW